MAHVTLKYVTAVCLAMGLFDQVVHAQHAQSVAGVVIDARTGRPLADVLVYVESGAGVVETDADGRFVMRVPPGRHTLVASLVGYAMLRQPLTVGPEPPAAVTLQLTEGVGAYSERVTVTARQAGAPDRTPGGAVLQGGDLQLLRGVVMDDPLRAAQSLPAAAATDDLYGEFAVRGNLFRNLGLTFDGVPAPYLMHTVHGIADAGSIAMVNTETLASVSLLPGSYPQRTGRRIGGQIDLVTREGSRDRVGGRAGLSGTSAAVLLEGPIQRGQGSFLVSARKSYLDYLIVRIDPAATFAFGFSDVEGVLTYDVSPRHRVQLTSIIGSAGFREDDAGQLSASEEADTGSRAWFSTLAWRYTPTSRFTMTHRLVGTGLRYANTNNAGATLDAARSVRGGWRSDASFAPSTSWLLEFGADAMRGSERRHHDERSVVLVGSPRGGYDETFRDAGAYLQARRAIGSRVFVTPGVRADYSNLTAATTTSPWLSATVDVGRGLTLQGGGGLYQQFPDPEHVFGVRGSSGLRPERAVHSDLGFSQTLGPGTTLQVTGYSRRERDVLRLPESEPRRLPNGDIRLQSSDSRWVNALDGDARGLEVLIRRTVPNGLSGSVAYALGRHVYTDRLTGEAFSSDADQRHSLSVNGRYRVTPRTIVSGKLRFGSNYPLRGYLGERPTPSGPPGVLRPPQPGVDPPLTDYELVEGRNTLRLPPYARLDVRVDRTVTWTRTQVTFFGEVANAFNRSNWRNVNYGLDPAGGVYGPRETLLPIVPSAGFVVEF